jgi:hypothetical protein
VTDTSASDSGYDLGILDASSVTVPDYQLYDMSATYEFTTSYEYLKKMIEKVQTDPEHRNVGSLSVERDNTGELVGTMTLNLYSLTGTEKVYETPDAGSIKKGRDDLFGALQSSKTEDTTANKNTKKSTKKK